MYHYIPNDISIKYETLQTHSHEDAAVLSPVDLDVNGGSSIQELAVDGESGSSGERTLPWRELQQFGLLCHGGQRKNILKV